MNIPWLPAWRVGLASLLAILCLPGLASAQLEPLAYHHPGLTVDLGVGLWAWPLPMDFDGDGDLDLVVNCPDKPSNGVYFFENASGDTARNPLPVFEPGRRISRGLQNVQVSYVEGRPVVLTPGKIYPNFLQSGLEAPQDLPLKVNVHPRKTRANMWRLVDYDGDGRQDLIIGVGDWTDYGWDNAYDAKGNWQNGPLRGLVYLARNRGDNAQPRYDDPVLLHCGDKRLEVYGWPSPSFGDFDGDGDLDLLCGEFLDGFTYFENRGDREHPAYATGQRLQAADKQPLTMDLQMITPTAFDWDRDGDLDLIVGDEDGRVAFVEHTGKLSPEGVPVFLTPRYFQQEAEHLKFGALSTPCAVDWDGDGDLDLLSGNTAGYIGFFENLSGPGVEQPRWNAPQRLQAGGQTIRIQAGENGSIQGPAEAKWGYTTLTAGDWDGDGLPDLLVNSILGKVVWYRNLGPREAPRLAAAAPIEVEWNGPQPTLAYGWLRPHGKELLTQWRTTPVAIDLDAKADAKADGLLDLVMLDHEGFLTLFPRAEQAGQSVLLPPRRIFYNAQGQPLQLNSQQAGKSGRRKICLTDWDGDGAIDLLVNSESAAFWRQTRQAEGKWFFEDKGPLSERKISGHTTSPTVVDFNGDAIPDLLVGAEDGRFYYLRNPRR
ncbi:FG-GAP repeat domain-containing protein [Lignipirellula cremea]|uniref:FG-GAP repeat protein n=1 Tax=Lignipirellula cremea TaxID=2528010 RepID=A0A518DL56_9BACT|nr:VCBS repeat-containing protein [Lignipirellula cremea]QDU92564.1 FG-GAP repeat protein [Lignipirellula cremea]